MSEASPTFLGPELSGAPEAPAAPAVPARSFDQMPAGFEDAFDPAARLAKLEAALSVNQYLDSRPAQTEHMDLQIDGRQTLADGSDNPHFGHTSIVRGEEPVRSAIDDSFVRSLDRPDRTMLGDLPKDERVGLLSSRNSVASLRDGITQTREALATAQDTHTETVKKPNKKGTKFLDHDVVIGPDRTAEADAQERLGDYMDALGTKLARSGMSDERVLQTLISLNEGTPAYKRKAGETKSGKAKYETVEAKPGLNLSEEEMTQVLDSFTRTQEQDEIAREIAKADEPLTPDEAALAARVLGERADDSAERGSADTATLATVGAAALLGAGAVYARSKGLETDGITVTGAKAAALAPLLGLRRRLARRRIDISERHEESPGEDAIFYQQIAEQSLAGGGYRRKRGPDEEGFAKDAELFPDAEVGEFVREIKKFDPLAAFVKRSLTYAPDSHVDGPGSRSPAEGRDRSSEPKNAWQKHIANQLNLDMDSIIHEDKIIHELKHVHGSFVGDRARTVAEIESGRYSRAEKRSLMDAVTQIENARARRKEKMDKLIAIANGEIQPGKTQTQEKLKTRAERKLPKIERKLRKREKNSQERKARRNDRIATGRYLRYERNKSLAEDARDRAGFYASLADSGEDIRDGSGTVRRARSPEGPLERRAKASMESRLSRLEQARADGDEDKIKKRKSAVDKAIARRRDHVVSSNRARRKVSRRDANLRKLRTNEAKRDTARARAAAITV